MARERRDWGSGNAVPTTLTAQLTAGVTTSFAIAASTRWPDGTDGNFYVGIDPTTDLTNPSSTFEVVKCSTRSGLTVNIAASGRGSDGTSDVTHASGARVWVIGVTQDFDEANEAVANTTGKWTAAGQLLVSTAAATGAALANGTTGLPLVAGASTPAYTALTDTGVAAANKDGAAGTASMRTLGTGAAQACAGNDSRLSDSRAPTGPAGGIHDGTYPNPGLAAAVAGAGLTETSDVLSVNVDGTTLAITTDTLGVKAGGIGATEIGTGAVGDDELATDQPARRRTLGAFITENYVSGATNMGLHVSGSAVGVIPTIRSGSITGLVLLSNQARTTGTLTAEVVVNGTPVGLTAVLDGTNTLTKVTTQAAGLDTYGAGDRIGVQLTGSSWGPTTADLTAMVEVTE